MSFFNLKFAVFFHEHVFIKDPGTTRGTPWHQDQPYYPVNGRKVLLESINLFFTLPGDSCIRLNVSHRYLYIKHFKK